MAFVVAKRLEPNVQDVTLPATITFTATIRNSGAPPAPTKTALELRLAEGNQLSFSPGALVKVKSVPRAIPATDKEFSFTETIHGSAGELASFRVVLVFPGGLESGCLVRLA